MQAPRGPGVWVSPGQALGRVRQGLKTPRKGCQLTGKKTEGSNPTWAKEGPSSHAGEPEPGPEVEWALVPSAMSCLVPRLLRAVKTGQLGGRSAEQGPRGGRCSRLVGRPHTPIRSGRASPPQSWPLPPSVAQWGKQGLVRPGSSPGLGTSLPICKVVKRGQFPIVQDERMIGVEVTGA